MIAGKIRMQPQTKRTVHSGVYIYFVYTCIYVHICHLYKCLTIMFHGQLDTSCLHLTHPHTHTHTHLVFLDEIKIGSTASWVPEAYCIAPEKIKPGTKFHGERGRARREEEGRRRTRRSEGMNPFKPLSKWVSGNKRLSIRNTTSHRNMTRTKRGFPFCFFFYFWFLVLGLRGTSWKTSSQVKVGISITMYIVTGCNRKDSYRATGGLWEPWKPWKL